MNKTRMISTGLKQFFLACMEFCGSKQHVCLNAHSFMEQCSYLRRATISSSEANIVVSIKESLGPSLGSKNALSALPSCFQQMLSMLFVQQIVPIFSMSQKKRILVMYSTITMETASQATPLGHCLVTRGVGFDLAIKRLPDRP